MRRAPCFIRAVAGADRRCKAETVPVIRRKLPRLARGSYRGPSRFLLNVRDFFHHRTASEENAPAALPSYVACSIASFGHLATAVRIAVQDVAR